MPLEANLQVRLNHRIRASELPISKSHDEETTLELGALGTRTDQAVTRVTDAGGTYRVPDETIANPFITRLTWLFLMLLKATDEETGINRTTRRFG